jgi:transcriptional regulator with XRE-family HTH domain
VVTRRIHALSAIGWTYEALASRLGVTHQNVGYLAGRTSGMVQRGIAQAVIRLYDELSMTPGPSSVARDRAAARGWPPPLAWDEGAIDDPDARPNHTSKREKRAAWRDVDEVAVARAINGARIELTGPERESAVEILVRTTDLSDKQIAARLDMWPETVFRIRKRLGLDSNYGTARRAS